LAFLQALETACLDSREVHENVFASLAADKTVAFGVVEPLYCTLILRWRGVGGTTGQVLADKRELLTPIQI
jgi:hypothetical protein